MKLLSKTREVNWFLASGAMIFPLMYRNYFIKALFFPFFFFFLAWKVVFFFFCNSNDFYSLFYSSTLDCIFF